MSSFIKYIGDFKDLIPKDWIFQKLYARNYRTYRKEFIEDTIWIWQKQRVIEINDFGTNSVWFLNKIISGEYKNWEVIPNSYTYEIRHDRKYSFGQEIVDYLLQMHLEGLIEIKEI